MEKKGKKRQKTIFRAGADTFLILWNICDFYNLLVFKMYT